MPLVAAAVCPHPPLLVPEVAGAASTELDELRTACDVAVARLLAAEPDRIVVIGCGPSTMTFSAAEQGSFHRYGIHRRVPLSPTNAADRADNAAVGPARLPLSVTIGAWLLGRAGTALPRSAMAVAADEPAARCATLGAGLLNPDLFHAGLFDPELLNAGLLGSVTGNASEGGTSTRLGLLVLGDGSACRVERSPGYDDPRAEPFDQAVTRALADADTRALGALDAELSAGLKATGRAPWQVLAGAVRAAGGAWRGELAYAAAPYGVTYLVASWAPSGAAR